MGSCVSKPQLEYLDSRMRVGRSTTTLASYIIETPCQRLSKKLYAILEEVEHLEQPRHSNRRAAVLIEDICNTYVFKDGLTVYISGSVYEGSMIPGPFGDVDIIPCFTVPPVLNDIQDTGFGISYLVEPSTKSGYVKLRLIVDGKYANKYDVDERDHKNFHVANESTLYLNRDHFEKEANIFNDAVFNGPAHALLGSMGRRVADIVYALRSEQIPVFAEEWLTRSRSSDWPSEELLHKLSRMGCLFVSVSHPESEDNALQWRLSFVLQERELFASLTQTQRNVYLLLKIAKNVLNTHVRDENGEGIISSYHCKTCLLHVAEIVPQRVWVENNLVECLLMCLEFLKYCIGEQRCPNYFVNDQNMFERKRIEINRNALIRYIDKIVATILDGNLSFFCDLNISNACPLLSANQFQFDRHRQTKVTWWFIIVTGIARDMLLFQNRPSSFANLRELLDRLCQSQSTEESLKETNRYVLPWIELRVGMSLAAMALSLEESSKLSSHIKVAMGHIDRGSDADFLHARLAKATVYLQLGQYQPCLKILRETDVLLTDKTATACYCDSRILYNIPRSFERYYEFEVDKDIGKISETEMRKQLNAGCFCFLPCDKALAPTPLLHQFKVCTEERNSTIHNFFKSWIMVNPKVYLYTLFYMVGAACDREMAVQKLLTILPQVVSSQGNVSDWDKGIYCHVDVTYNILGWIMMQEKQYLAAVKYFLKSWKLCPGDNAAKYHIRDLFRQIEHDANLPEHIRSRLGQIISSAIHFID